MTIAMRRGVALALLAGALAVVVGLTRSGDSDKHSLFVTTKDANNMLAGQDVRLAGVKVGSIGKVDATSGGRAARVEIKLSDVAWPVRRDAKLQLRWGGTVNFNNRYLALSVGSAGNSELRDGQSLPASSLTVPVEYDQFVGTFTPGVRRDLRALVRNGADSLDAAQVAVRRTLSRTPPALGQLHPAINDLVEDEGRLDTLVRSASATVRAIDEANPGLRELLASAGTTLDATADRATRLRETLSAAPATFVNVRDTLKRADPTLNTVGRLAVRVAPGVVELRKLTPPLNSALATVVQVGPDATDSLATARRATRDLNPLLSKATTLMPDLRSIGSQLTKELPCLRPYTPDIVGFVSNWGDFISSGDGKDKYFRAVPQVLLPASTNTQSYDSEAAANAFPGLRYAFPRPPGNNAGKPWFLPECGVTEDALDPSKDPESRTAVKANERIPAARATRKASR